MPDIEKELEKITGLISLPEIYLKVRRLMDDETADIDDFAGVIIVDPNLSTRVLKLVNSAYFGFEEPVDSITRAINMIGITQLHNLVLGASAMSSLDLPNDILPLKPFWHTSLLSGVLAQQLASRLRLERSDRLFIAGLLHEVGHLILCARFSDYARESIRRSVQFDCPLHETQREMLGCHYGDIGAMLLANWNLPPELQGMVRYQPAPAAAPAQRVETIILHLAHACAREDTSAAPLDAAALIDPGLRAEIDLTQEEIGDALQTAHRVSQDIGRSILN